MPTEAGLRELQMNLCRFDGEFFVYECEEASVPQVDGLMRFLGCNWCIERYGSPRQPTPVRSAIIMTETNVETEESFMQIA